MQHQATNQVLSTHSQLMMKTTVGCYNGKKQNSGASSSTLKERSGVDNNRRTEDEKAFAKGIMAVGSEKHLKYNNLKKQLQKQKEERKLSNKSGAAMLNAGIGDRGSSSQGNNNLHGGKKQNLMKDTATQQATVIDEFTNPMINEHLSSPRVTHGLPEQRIFLKKS